MGDQFGHWKGSSDVVGNEQTFGWAFFFRCDSAGRIGIGMPEQAIFPCLQMVRHAAVEEILCGVRLGG